MKCFKRLRLSLPIDNDNMPPPKRKRTFIPPRRCHSCNRAETSEWRRGPDGARTLCNACGLHYAKLTKKNTLKLHDSGVSTQLQATSAPPARCHSCNRAETSEWRRGPDGEHTLCNACGLHYAKLMRKNNLKAEDKSVGS
jgi:Zn ribbon nucleic-acid-binding protein